MTGPTMSAVAEVGMGVVTSVLSMWRHGFCQGCCHKFCHGGHHGGVKDVVTSVVMEIVRGVVIMVVVIGAVMGVVSYHGTGLLRMLSLLLSPVLW